MSVDAIARFDFATAVPTKLDFEYEPTKEQLGLAELQSKNKQEIRALLVDMLRREDEYRLGKKVQEAYRLIGDSEGGLSDFTTQIQAHVSREFNVDPKIGIELIRSAVSLFPDDAEIKSIPHYVRHNRCFEGNLRAGDTPPDCRVVALDGVETTIRGLLNRTGPVVLLAASHT